jgi:hypothetical protein
MADRPSLRLFTVDEANALLPVVRSLMERVRERLEALRALSQKTIRRLGLEPDDPELMARLKSDSEVARVIREVRELVEEIDGLGCICKGVEQGLVDFPCLLGGEVVYLCWRYGEESVSHWHTIEAGFAGRKPLLAAGEGEPGGNVSYH